jgi:hypothetical protein
MTKGLLAFQIASPHLYIIIHGGSPFHLAWRLLQCMIGKEWYDRYGRRIIGSDTAIETQSPRPWMTQTFHRVRLDGGHWVGGGTVPKIHTCFRKRVGDVRVLRLASITERPLFSPDVNIWKRIWVRFSKEADKTPYQLTCRVTAYWIPSIERNCAVCQTMKVD